jgi:hypothetical protein
LGYELSGQDLKNNHSSIIVVAHEKEGKIKLILICGRREKLVFKLTQNRDKEL